MQQASPYFQTNQSNHTSQFYNIRMASWENIKNCYFHVFITFQSIIVKKKNLILHNIAQNTNFY